MNDIIKQTMLTFYIVGIQVQQDSLENWKFNLLVIFFSIPKGKRFLHFSFTKYAAPLKKMLTYN